jgi:transcriptional regulator with XRE-family HTH domain
MKGARKMSEKHDNPFHPYQLQFTTQRRKQFIAEMMSELRKAKSYQQKEVAELLKISPQTYNGYETARNEPPIEILVRLSYLYDMPIDVLVQRDRKHDTDESVLLTLNSLDSKIEEVRKQLEKSPVAENEQLNALLGMFGQLTDAVKAVAEKGDISK